MNNRKHNRGLRQWFPASNAWGIPDLLPELCYSGSPPQKLHTYRAGRHHDMEGQVLGLFTDDYRFECSWSYPQRMVSALRSAGWSAVCEPDFSVWSDAPEAEQMWNVYRTRWCGRLWQDHGISVIPVLQWGASPTWEFCWSGIPGGVKYVAIETQSCGRNVEAWNRGLAAAIEVVQPETVLVYGSLKSGMRVVHQCFYYENHVNQMCRVGV
jgi:hypothetical protein